MTLRHCFTIAVLFLAIHVAAPAVQAAAVNKTIGFDPVPTGLASRLVYDAWMHDPEYAELTKSMDMPPAYMLARGDLNGDGTDEIFARHSDSDLTDYCPGFGAECRLHIYKLVKGQLIEIGRMFSSLNVVVLPQAQGGYHNLQIERAGHKVVEYVWDGQKYKEK